MGPTLRFSLGVEVLLSVDSLQLRSRARVRALNSPDLQSREVELVVPITRHREFLSWV